MKRFTEDTTKEELSQFISSLPEQFFTHKDVMRCYSIFQRNEFQRNARAQQLGTVQASSTEDKPRPAKRRWTDVEIEAIKRGVERFGAGDWIAVLKAFPTVFGPSGRTAKDLERKWAALVAKGDTTPSHDLELPMAVPPLG
jgi:hypothetical protein